MVADVEHELSALVEAQIGSLLEFLPVAVVVTSASGSVLRANPAATALLGPRERLIGQSIGELLRGHALSVRIRLLAHDDDRIRLYVLQERGVGRASISALHER